VREYTVKAGDICDSISAANNVSTYVPFSPSSLLPLFPRSLFPAHFSRHVPPLLPQASADAPPRYQLAALNPGTIDPACSNLQPGSSICIGSEGEDCASTYIVQLGNTCEDVYKAAQVNSTIFYLNNPQVSLGPFSRLLSLSNLPRSLRRRPPFVPASTN
jgi:hypothetical protein